MVRAWLLVVAIACAVLAQAAVADARSALQPVRVGVDAATVRAKLPKTAPRGASYRFQFRRVRAGARPLAWQRTSRRRARTPLSGRARKRARVVSARLTGLRPSTRYAYRLVVGSKKTRERRFRTRARRAPRPEPAPPAPAPAPVASAAAVAPRSPALPGPQPVRETPPPAPAPVVSYTNPVSPVEMPDPMILRVGDTYYAYGTADGFTVMRSKNLTQWTVLGRAMERRPSWAVQAGEWHPWAPSVLRRDGACPGEVAGPCFVMFHTAMSTAFGPTTNCVGIATSPSPEGPFREQGILRGPGGELIGCGDDAGYGNIDAAPFVDDDGTLQLYVSTDFACAAPTVCELKPTLAVIPLHPDGLSAAGERTPLFSGRPGTWEQAPWAPVVENPWVVRRGSTYHLLYSGGAWDGDYAMGHATSSSPQGPFTRSTPEPILRGTNDVRGPGGGMSFEGPGGRQWVVYHGRARNTAARTMRIDELDWHGDGTPTVNGPTTLALPLLP